MGNAVPLVQLNLNPERHVAIIDAAVVATNEIVNFHFKALAGANLAQPAEANGRFQIRGPEISTEERRALYESWILASVGWAERSEAHARPFATLTWARRSAP